MRTFSYAWSLPVTWQRWRLHHLIHHIQKPHATRKHHGFILCRFGVVLYCGIAIFDFLLLWPWSWPDDLNIRTWPVFRGDTPDVQIWTSYVKARLSKVIVWQTDTTEIIYHTALRVVKYGQRNRHVQDCPWSHKAVPTLIIPHLSGSTN